MFLRTATARRRAGLLLAGLALALTTASAQTAAAPAWGWARGLHGVNYDVLSAVSTDAQGNAYVAGSFDDAARLGNPQLISAGQTDALVAKLDAQGNVVWTRTFGSVRDDWAEQVVTDAQGNVYVGGHFEGIVTFDSITLSAGPYGSGMFVAKLDAQGTVLWAQQAISTNFAAAYGLQPDGTGGAYVALTFTDDVTMGSTGLYGSGSLLARLDGQGGVQWVRQQSSKPTGFSDQVTGNALAVGGGYVYAAGGFIGTVTFGSTPLTSSASTDAWLASYDAQGNLRWLRQGGSHSGFDMVRGLAADASGQVYASGEFSGATTFGSLTLPGSGISRDARLFKFDAQGNGLWARQLAAGPGRDYAAGLALDMQDNVYLTGGFSPGAQIEGTALTNQGQLDAFVASYTALGSLRWVHMAGGPGNDEAYALSTPTAAGLCLAGSFDGGSSTFGAATLVNEAVPATTYLYDGFVARLTNVISSARPARAAAPLSLYPNPATDRVQLPDLPAGSQVELLDALGRLVRPARTGAELSVRGLPAGVYTLLATDGQGQRYTARLLVR